MGAHEPKRALGLWRSTALVVGNMIGSGIFLLPASLAAFGAISVVGWLFTTTGAVLIALVFARLSRTVPRAGGLYAYTRLGLGDMAGFLVAWGYWISIWAGNAAIATGFAGYMGVFFPAVSKTPLLSALTATAAIWALTWVNATGVRSAAIVQVVTTLLKLLPLVAVAALGLFFFKRANFIPFNASGQSAVAAISATAALTLWAFLGLESATIPADDVIDPHRTIPRATILGTLSASVVYILGTVSIMGVIPPATLAKSTAPYAEAATMMWGNWASYAVAAGAAISCFGALNGWILLQGQIPLAVARDGLFPAAFARLSRNGTPAVGIVIGSVLATILLSMNFAKGLVEAFTFIILIATLACLVPYTFCSAADAIIAIRQGSETRDRLRPALLVVPGLAFIYSLWAIGGSGKDTVYWGFLLILAGIPVYVWKKAFSGDTPKSAESLENRNVP